MHNDVTRRTFLGAISAGAAGVLTGGFTENFSRQRAPVKARKHFCWAGIFWSTGLVLERCG